MEMTKERVNKFGERLIGIIQCEEKQENDWKNISTEHQDHAR